MTHDLIVIGAGPAGLTAGIYAARAGLKTAILERTVPGGHAATTHHIENYPGFPEGISGFDLAERMKQQVARFGVEIVGTEAKVVERRDKSVLVKTDGSEFLARALIIAIGTIWKKLDVSGEDALSGRGVSYCATCDGPLFKKKDVAVVGCGNSGLQEGKFLLQFVNRILFVEYLPHVTADKLIYDRIKDDKRVEFFLNHKVLSINGKDRVDSIGIQNRETGEKRELSVSGVFIYVGLEPNTGMLENVVGLDEKGFVKVNERMETSAPGIFAAGDVCARTIRQVVTACAEGAIAAISAYHYIESTE